MALTRWDPFTTLARLDDFDELVRRAWGGQPRPSTISRSTAGYVPAIEMTTSGSDVLITLELPGVDIDNDIDIEVAEGRLTISGERRESSEHRHDSQDGGSKVLVRELRYGSFRRDFALPDGVGADDVEASYDKGMLAVRVRNVTKPVTPPRKVAIRGTDEAKARTTIEGRAEQPES
jgi:HSP20 family protein